MARVPQAKDIAVSSFNVGNAAQIDIGVAKEIGRAGSAIGDAVAALGGAFGEIAGKASAAQSAQAEADYILDWNQKDFNVWSGLSKNETPDGTSWQAAAPAYTETFNSHRSDPKYSSIPADKKVRLDRQIAGSIQQRIIGEGGAARRYQTGQYNTLVGDLKTRTETTIGELGPDSPLVQGLPQTQGDSAYNRLYEERRNALHAKIDASVGMTLSPKQAEEEKAKVDSALFQTKLQWLQKNDPDAYEKVLEEAGKLEREPVSEPQEGGATNETWRGPGSDGKPVGSLDTSEFKDYTKGRGGRPLQTVENIILHDVSGPGGGRVPKGGNIPNYHITFDKNGVYLENPIDRQAPHARSFNKNSIGIAHIGYEGDKLDPQAVANGAKAVAYVMQQTGVPAEKILTHPGAGPSATKSGKDPREASWRNEVLAYIDQNKEQLFAGKMGSLGSEDAQRVAGAQAGGFKADLTAYSPQAKGSKTEGGYAAAKPGPDGKAEVRTLDDVLSGKSEYVTLAGNPSQYGKEYVIPSITYVDKAGREHTLKNVRAVVHDTGSAFKKAGGDRFDVAIARDVSNKTMAANHTRWKKEGVQFVAASPEGEAPPVSERGLVQVAGLKQAQEGVQVADASGTIPQSAIQEFMARNGGKLQEVASTEPNTPIAEIVDPAELEAIRSQLPEGIDVNAVTAGDAQELLSQAAPEVAQASGLHDSTQVAQAAQERPLGPVLGGYQFSVPSKYGNIKFRSEEWNNMKPETIKQLQKDFKFRREIATKQTQAIADEMMRAQIGSLENEGKPLEPRLINPDIIDKAYPPGTPKRVAHEKKVAALSAVAELFSNDGDKSVDELMYGVEAMKPQQSKSATAEEYNVRLEAYKSAQKRMEKIITMREEDPAEAVETSAMVQSVREKFQNGVPKSQNEKRALIEARMAAQRQIGIPEEKRSPITDGEASYYASKLKDVPEEEINSRIEDLAASVKQNYGKDYSGVVVKAIIREYLSKSSQREMMGQAITWAQQLYSDRSIGNLDYQKAKDIADMSARRIRTWVPNNVTMRGSRVVDELMPRQQGSAPSQAPMMEGLIGGSGTGSLTQGLVGRTTGKPSQDDIDALRRDPRGLQQQFEKKYGLTPAQSANYILKGRP